MINQETVGLIMGIAILYIVVLLICCIISNVGKLEDISTKIMLCMAWGLIGFGVLLMIYSAIQLITGEIS